MDNHYQNDILQQYNYTIPSTIALNCVKVAEILLDLLGGEAMWNCASSKNGQVLQNEGGFCIYNVKSIYP